MLSASLPAAAHSAQLGLPPRRRSREAPEPEEYGAERDLAKALADTYRDRWRGLRSEQSIYSQARTAAIFVAGIVLREAGEALDDHEDRLLRSVRIGEITHRHITEAIRLWQAEVSAGTINKRLDCLGLMGMPTKGRRQRRPKVLKCPPSAPMAQI